MDIKYLYYFCELARNEHYGKTADDLGIAQPALSRMIHQLESELGVYLFERSGRNVKLTKYGKTYYEHVKKGLSYIDAGTDLVHEMAHPYSGTIDLGFIYTLGPEIVPYLFKKFMADEKNKDFKFNFYQGNTPRLLEHLDNYKFDLALCSYLEHQKNITFTHLFDQELVAIVAKEHPLASRTEISLCEASEHPCILSLDKTHYIEGLFYQQNLKPDIVCRVEEDQALAGLVSVNYGLAILPRNRLLEHYNLHVLRLTDDSCIRPIYLAVNKNAQLMRAARSFHDFVLQEGAKLSTR